MIQKNLLIEKNQDIKENDGNQIAQTEIEENEENNPEKSGKSKK